MKRHWYERTILVFFVFCTISVLCLAIVSGLHFGQSVDSRYTVYSIRFEYFGMDAVEMERLITIPLEEKVSILSEIHKMQSVCEYGKSITTLYFDRSVDQKNTYLALRDAVDTLYYTLPNAVQKPRIYSSDTNQKPILAIAFAQDGDLAPLRKYIDTEIKKKLEAIEGVAEVISAGGSIEEIQVHFDPYKTVQSGIQPSGLGYVIQDANIVLGGGILEGNGQNVPFVFDTRIQTLEEIRNIPVKVGEGITSLEYLADISLGMREKQEIVRINGTEAVSLQIKASFLGNSMAISQEVQTVLQDTNFDYTILYDAGAQLYTMMKEVLFAVLVSFVCVIIIIPFFYKSLKTVLLLLVILPINTVWTFAVLNLLGFSVNQNTLAGISISLGLIIDASLVIASFSEIKDSFFAFKQSVQNVRGAILSSSATTVLVLIPLYFMERIVPGIRMIVITIGIMIVNSVVLSYIFLPCFIYDVSNGNFLPVKLFSRCKWGYTRFSYRLSLFSIKHKKICVSIFLCLMLVPFVLFAFLGKNISLEDESDVIFASIEYDSEKRADVIDSEIRAFVSNVESEYGVTFVHTEVNKGVAEVEVGYDIEIIDRKMLIERIIFFESKLQEGFLYIPERGQSNTSQFQEITVAITGDDSNTCKEMARQAVEAFYYNPRVAQVVLNFKDNEADWVLYPDDDILLKSGLTVERVASELRWILFGPVVDKRLHNGDETDIRVMGKNMRGVNLDTIKNIYIATESGGIKLDTLGRLVRNEGSGKIYRKDGRRAAYFTITFNTKSSDEAIDLVTSTMNSLPQKKGYGYFLPRELALLNEQYTTLFFAFIFSIVGIIILLTAFTENIGVSLRIASIIPVSAAVPFLVLYLSGQSLELGHILGMVLVSGISVNNAIYLEESKKTGVIFKVREKAQSILVTSLTTIVSSIPLLFAGRGSFSGDLAFFMILGVVGSVVVTLLIYPALCTKRTIL